jgi:hypothetical protein
MSLFFSYLDEVSDRSFSSMLVSFRVQARRPGGWKCGMSFRSYSLES